MQKQLRYSANVTSVLVSQFTACLVVVCVDSTTIAENSHPDLSDSAKTARIQMLLNECPAWSEIGDGSDDERNEIKRIANAIADESTDVIRNAFSDYIKHLDVTSEKYTGNMSKIYVLNRFLFKVPDAFSLDKARYFGGWGGAPPSVTTADLLWPLSHSKDGSINLTGTFGGCSGARYRAIDEFNFFERTFGRRKAQKVKK